MKIVTLITFILCGIGSSYAQKELITELTKQAVTIDSLKRVVKNHEQSDVENHSKLKKLQDTAAILKSDLSKLENFKVEKTNIDRQIKLKSDSIALLKSDLAEKNKELKTREQNFRQQLIDARENSRNEIVKVIVDYYKNKSFDDLIKSSTQESILKDKGIIGSKGEIEPVFSSLEKYFIVKS